MSKQLPRKSPLLVASVGTAGNIMAANMGAGYALWTSGMETNLRAQALLNSLLSIVHYNSDIDSLRAALANSGVPAKGRLLKVAGRSRRGQPRAVGTGCRSADEAMASFTDEVRQQFIEDCQGAAEIYVVGNIGPNYTGATLLDEFITIAAESNPTATITPVISLEHPKYLNEERLANYDEKIKRIRRMPHKQLYMRNWVLEDSSNPWSRLSSALGFNALNFPIVGAVPANLLIKINRRQNDRSKLQEVFCDGYPGLLSLCSADMDSTVFDKKVASEELVTRALDFCLKYIPFDLNWPEMEQEAEDEGRAVRVLLPQIHSAYIGAMGDVSQVLAAQFRLRAKNKPLLRLQQDMQEMFGVFAPYAPMGKVFAFLCQTDLSKDAAYRPVVWDTYDLLADKLKAAEDSVIRTSVGWLGGYKNNTLGVAGIADLSWNEALGKDEANVGREKTRGDKSSEDAVAKIKTTETVFEIWEGQGEIPVVSHDGTRDGTIPSEQVVHTDVPDNNGATTDHTTDDASTAKTDGEQPPDKEADGSDDDNSPGASGLGASDLEQSITAGANQDAGDQPVGDTSADATADGNQMPDANDQASSDGDNTEVEPPVTIAATSFTQEDLGISRRALGGATVLPPPVEGEGHSKPVLLREEEVVYSTPIIFQSPVDLVKAVNDVFDSRHKEALYVWKFSPVVVNFTSETYSESREAIAAIQVNTEAWKYMNQAWRNKFAENLAAGGMRFKLPMKLGKTRLRGGSGVIEIVASNTWSQISSIASARAKELSREEAIDLSLRARYLQVFDWDAFKLLISKEATVIPLTDKERDGQANEQSLRVTESQGKAKSDKAKETLGLIANPTP